MPCSKKDEGGRRGPFVLLLIILVNFDMKVAVYLLFIIQTPWNDNEGQ